MVSFVRKKKNIFFFFQFVLASQRSYYPLLQKKKKKMCVPERGAFICNYNFSLCTMWVVTKLLFICQDTFFSPTFQKKKQGYICRTLFAFFSFHLRKESI